MSAWNGWEAQVLQRLGAVAGPNALGMLTAWHLCEGGSATFNPMNTTLPKPGATNYNSVGVKNYPSIAVGLDATVDTLTNGFYDGIVRDLRSGRWAPAAIVSRNAAEFSKWGTSTVCLAQRTIGTIPHVATPPRPTPQTQFGSVPSTVGTHAELPASAFGAWGAFVRALGVTVPTQNRRARQARNHMTRAIR